jgi:hypothetical protein
VDRLLGELASELRDGRYRPLPARRVFIPKPGRPDERRPLSIPSVRDRIVQAAVKIVLEPVFEADMLPCSFGFRPKRGAHDGLQVLIDGPQTASGGGESGRGGDAVTHGEAEWIEISSPDDGVTVRLPAELPALTSRAARALLAILVELTEVPVLDRPAKGVR